MLATVAGESMPGSPLKRGEALVRSRPTLTVISERMRNDAVIFGVLRGLKSLLVVSVLLAVAGCGGEVWTKAGATRESVAHDRDDCQREATSRKRYSAPFFDRALFRQCMEARGYAVQREP